MDKSKNQLTHADLTSRIANSVTLCLCTIMMHIYGKCHHIPKLIMNLNIRATPKSKHKCKGYLGKVLSRICVYALYLVTQHKEQH